jgi:RNA polymerase sigma factor (sigma-70 family)
MGGGYTETRRLVVAKGTAAVLKRAIRSVEARLDQSGISDRELIQRFAQENDQAAFAALVRRYTSMVLGVCRRVLPSVQDAEDACQATFLVLARKAAAGQWRQSVANWLYTTARRIAANARRATERRARREGKAAVSELVQPADQMTGRELLSALDEELDKLSARYREPLVLCYLEGLTRDEVASRLGIPAGTVKIQLERGRKKLGDALLRRGCGLGAGLLALAVTTSPAGAAPLRLIEAVLASVSGSPPAAVAALARGVTMNAFMNKAMSIVLALVTAGVFSIGIAAVRLPAASQTAGQTARKAAPAKLADDRPKDPRPREDKRETTVSGRVLSPDGKPVAGAELLLVGGKNPVQKLGRTDEDGHFTVPAPRGERWVVLLARAPGAGIDFIDLGTLKSAEKVDLRLVKDHAIRGRVIDTEGKPVPGVSVSVKSVNGYQDNSLDSFLAMWKKRHPMSGVPTGIKHFWEENIFPTTTTDKEGRFTVTGTGIERLVSLHVRGPGIAEAEFWVVNRPGFDPKPYNKLTTDNMATMSFGLGGAWLLWGPDLSVVAEAEKPIRGVVKDRETGKPRAGVRVTLSRNGSDLVPVQVSTTTDAQGRYEIRGARKSLKGYMVEVPGESESGYMACQGRSPDTPGYGAITIDVNVRKGVILTGRVFDSATGKSLPGTVWVGVLQGNPFAKEYPEFDSASSFSSRDTAADGTFRIVTIPGPVLLMGGPDTRKMSSGEMGRYQYKPPVADPKYPRYFPKERGWGEAYYTLNGGISPLQGNFAKVIEIKSGTGIVTQDVVLERASALPVKIVDGDNRPIRGTWVAGISPQDWHRPVQLPKDTCNAYHLMPGKPRLLAVYDPASKQYGTLRLKGDEKNSAVVKLGPGGTVKGRLIGENGRPVGGAVVHLYHQERTAEEVLNHAHRTRLIETDADGKFTAEVIPDVKFSVYFTRGKRTIRPVKKIDESVAPGKAFDLGDVKINLESSTGEE